MLYWGVFVFLSLIALQECSQKRPSVKIFNLCFLVLTLMVVLRKGQGQDYYNYLLVYNETVHWGNISPWSILILSDPLYRFLNWGAYCLGVGYPLFASIFSLATMMIVYPFFKNYCKCSVLALLIYYSLCYIIYNFSGVRQGFVMSLELSVLLPLLLQKRWRCYYLILVPLMLIHMSAIICAVFPIVARRKVSRGALLLMVLLSTPIMLSGINILSYLPLPGIIASRINYYTQSSGHFMAYAVRILLISPIFLIPNTVYNKNNTLSIVRNILVLGYVLYAFTAFNEVLSSRLNTYFRVFEFYFIYLLLHKTSLRVINRQLAIGYIAIYTILFASNINGFISQGGYKSSNVLTYPYLSVFDSDNAILEYRTKLGYGNEEILGVEK